MRLGEDTSIKDAASGTLSFLQQIQQMVNGQRLFNNSLSPTINNVPVPVAAAPAPNYTRIALVGGGVLLGGLVLMKVMGRR